METQQGPDTFDRKNPPEREDGSDEGSALKEDVGGAEKAYKSQSRIQRARRGYAYLRKRDLVRAVMKASQVAAQEALRVNGHILIAENGWLVKVHQDGSKDQLRPLNP